MKAKVLNSAFREEVVALLGVMDQQLGYGAESGPFTYIQQRNIINSLFAKNSALDYTEKSHFTTDSYRLALLYKCRI